MDMGRSISFLTYHDEDVVVSLYSRLFFRMTQIMTKDIFITGTVPYLRKYNFLSRLMYVRTYVRPYL